MQVVNTMTRRVVASDATQRRVLLCQRQGRGTLGRLNGTWNTLAPLCGVGIS